MKITATQIMDGLRNLAANLGTPKDKRAHSEYVKRRFASQQLEDMYTESWLFGKVIDIPVDDMTRAWRTVFAESLKPEQIAVFRKEEERLNYQMKINEAKKWARLYGGCLIFMGINDGKDLSEPRDRIIKRGQLEYLNVIERPLLSVQQINQNDPSKKTFLTPEYYLFAGGHAKVHHSRVIRFEGVKLPYRRRQSEEYWGGSTIQRIYDTVVNSASISDSIASLIFEAKLDIIHVPELMHKLSTKNGETQLIERFLLSDTLKSNNNLILLDEQEKFERKTTNFANLDALKNEAIAEVAGAADIPVTRFAGKSPTGLSATGESDIRDYYDGLSSKQESELRPQMTELDEVVLASVYGFIPPDWTFEFNPLWQMSEKERGEVEKLRADTDAIYLDRSVVTPAIVATSLQEEKTYSAVDAEYVEDLEGLEGLEPEPPEKEGADE